MSAQNLAQPPPDAIADHGSADSFGRHKPDPKTGLCFDLQDSENDQFSANRPPFRSHLRKLPAPL